MSERLRSDSNVPSFAPPADIAGSGLRALVPEPTADEMLAACATVPANVPLGFSGIVGTLWHDATSEYTIYNHVAPPNSQITDCSRGSYSLDQPGNFVGPSGSTGMLSARSRHRGGVNCLFGDGAARMVSDSVDLAVWRASSTIAGEERLAQMD